MMGWKELHDFSMLTVRFYYFQQIGHFKKAYLAVYRIFSCRHFTFYMAAYPVGIVRTVSPVVHLFFFSVIRFPIQV